MPTIVMFTIKTDIDSLYLSRDAGGTLFVDKAYAGASDSNDGLSATSPKLTIMGAVNAAGPGWTIRIAPGSYAENVVIPAGSDGIQLVGRARDGPNKTSIAPTTGNPLTINCSYAEISYLELVDITAIAGSTCLSVTGYRHKIHDIAVMGASDGCIGISLSNVDYGEIHDCYLNGAYVLNGIGILIIGDSIGTRIYHNYITKWGSGSSDPAHVPGDPLAHNGYGIGRDHDAQRIAIEENDIIDNFVGVYFYPPPGATGLEGDYVGHNNFLENRSYDVWDSHAHPTSAIAIDENFYGYTTGSNNWYDDPNGDNIADLIVICGTTNRDRHPVPSPYSWKNNKGNSRVGVI
jgi:hypothetical protein